MQIVGESELLCGCKVALRMLGLPFPKDTRPAADYFFTLFLKFLRAVGPFSSDCSPNSTPFGIVNDQNDSI